MPPSELRCGLDANVSGQALCEFFCPVCGRLGYAHTNVDGMTLLASEGATLASGSLPFELLERHAGPPLCWDDLLDAVLCLRTTLFPQRTLLQPATP